MLHNERLTTKGKHDGHDETRRTENNTKNECNVTNHDMRHDLNANKANK